MSFLKKFNRQKSVDLEEEARKKDEKEKASEMKKAKRHSVHISSRRDKPDIAVDVQSKDDSIVEDRGMQKKKEADRKERERRKFKDMSGMVLTSSNEYPVFIVHYLGRMPADAEFGRQAVEDPVHQLCKLRVKQKLPKVLLAFNVDGMMCREVTGPFLKPKKEGCTFFIPLHHITYGVASLTHPQVFAIISKMTDDPSPANQVLVLHAYLCDKAEDAQGLTYWQLQAYIEAFEDLKRKRMLKQRRQHAMGKHGPPPSLEAGTSGGAPAPASDSVDPGGASAPANGGNDDVGGRSSTKSKHKNPPPSPSSAKGPDVKPKRTNSVTSTTSSSSSSASSSTKVTPTPARKTSDKDVDEGTDIVHMSQKQVPGKMKIDAWPPSKRGPPPKLRGPPPTLEPLQVGSPPAGQNGRSAQGRTDSKDSAYDEGEDEFPIAFSPTSASASQSPSMTGSVFPGIAPRRPSESDPNKTASFENRISELQNLVAMDAEKLKQLMINDYPTLSRKILYKMAIDQNGVVTRKETPIDDQGPTPTKAVAAPDDSVV